MMLLFGLSIAVALLVVWFTVTRPMSRLRAFILALAALLLVAAICIAVGYFELRVHINDHYEINLVMLEFFVLPPIAAGVIAGALSAAMFRALKRREHGTPTV
jgi:uncharacterized membrane protein YqjE